MRKIIYALITLLALSCKEKRPLLTGTWEYISMERFDGSTPDLNDSLNKQIQESNLGFTFIFDENNNVRSYRKSASGEKKDKTEAKYEMGPDEKSITIKDPEGGNHIFRIISLSKDFLKITFSEYSEEFMVFKRMPD